MALNILTICGSNRGASASKHIARLVVKALKELDGTGDCSLLDLQEANIPFWNNDFWNETPEWRPIWQPISAMLTAADGFVTVTPEWGGMVPPSLKNFFLLCGPPEVGHKPNLIVSVSAGRGGAYPVGELRFSGYKNNKICHVPDHVIVRFVNRFLQQSEKERVDSYEMQRLRWSLEVLLSYADALQKVRCNDFIFDTRYEDGM